MAKVLRGLVKEPTFEELLGSDTYVLDNNISIYSSAALNYRQSFFAPPLGQPDVIDGEHDAKVEAVLAQMRAIAAAQEQRQDVRRENDRAMFAHVLATHRANMQEHAAQPPPPAAPPPAPGPANPAPPGVVPPPAPPLAQHSPVGILGSAGAHDSWQQRERDRRQQYKPTPVPGNEVRQRARQQAERAAELNRRRAEATVERYDIDRSPDPGPRSEMQERYDERIRQRTTPLTARTVSARAASASRGRQAATSQQREGRDRVITQRRSRALIPAASAPSLDEIGRRRQSRIDTPPRRLNIGPLATTPRLP